MDNNISVNPVLEQRFHTDMLAIYEQCKEQVHYQPSHLFKLVNDRGGLAAAKDLITQNPSVTFTTLKMFGRLDLSVEALVLKEEYQPMFTQAEIKACRDRLAKEKYIIAKD